MKKLLLLSFVLGVLSLAPSSNIPFFIGNTGNLLIVDQVHGSDTTGKRENFTASFKTLSVAKSAAQSGDTIVVLPGSYTGSNLLKNGVNWDFRPGAIVSNNSVSAGIFSDGADGANTAITSIIYGSGQFYTSGSFPIVYLEKTGSQITFYGKSLSSTSSGTNGFPIWQNGNNTLSAYLDSITSTDNTLIYWTNGQCDIYATQLSTSSTTAPAVTSTQQTGDYGQFYLHSDLIQNTATGGAVIGFGTLESMSRTWINALQIVGSETVNMQGSGKLYITAEKILGRIHSGGSNGGELYVSAQKIAPFSSDDYANFLYDCGSGTVTSDISIDTWDASNLTGGVIFTLSGTHRINNPKIVAPVSTLTDSAVNVSGGTVTIQNPIIDTSANTAVNSVVISSGTLNVLNPFISSNASKKDFSRSGGTLNVTNGRGSGNNGTFTISGTVNFLSGTAGYGSGTSNPSDGSVFQLFRNTTDTHIYGWNGSAWKQLDN